MSAKLDTVVHGSRIVHPLFGTVDLLNVLQAKGKRLRCGNTGKTSLGNGRDLEVRVKAVWNDEKLPRLNDVVLIVAALPIPPADLAGCAIEWEAA